MHTSGKMVFTMTLLAAATPFVLPTVLAPARSGNPHAALVGNAHPADFGNAHPADFGNPHPADFGDPHPALTAETHSAFPTELSDEENVTIDPSHVHGNVTFAFPHAAHVTIVLPDGVQFAVNDSRGSDQQHQQRALAGQTNAWPGFAPLVPPVLQTDINRNPGAQVVTDTRTGALLPPPALAVVTNRSLKPITEPAGAQPHIQFRNTQQH